MSNEVSPLDAVIENTVGHESTPIDHALEGKQEERANSLLSMYDGLALNTTNLEMISRSEDIRFIVLGGLVNSGKTTLLSSIYESFLDGYFGGLIFGGSRTLIEYERICHRNRIASNRLTPETDRTPVTTEYPFLHLRVKNKGSIGKAINLIFSNISGEIFSEIKNSTEEAKNHPIINRTDHFVLVVDGEKVANVFERSRAISDANMILRRILDCNLLPIEAHVNVICTKYDIIVNDNIAKDYLNSIVKKTFLDPYKDRVKSIDFNYIAARPTIPKNDIKKAHGIESLINTWANVQAQRRYVIDRGKPIGEIKREYDFYGYRQRFIGIEYGK